MPRRLFAVLVSLFCLQNARADLTLSFSTNNATIGVGESIEIDVILEHIDPIVGTDIRSNGIVAADIELQLDTPNVDVTSLRFGPGFQDSFVGSDVSIPLLSIESIDFVNGVRAPVGSPSAITLGSFTFTGITPGTTRVIAVDTGFTEFLFAADPTPVADIDALIFGSQTLSLNVSAIPEPSCVALLAMSSAWCCVRHRRKKRFFADTSLPS
ncbi:MAG: hypothetical protein KDB00_09940 [Planctomycetales bacterium]|nr:hypothetical protein [Planctomycetales bacterium]